MVPIFLARIRGAEAEDWRVLELMRGGARSEPSRTFGFFVPRVPGRDSGGNKQMREQINGLASERPGHVGAACMGTAGPRG